MLITGASGFIGKAVFTRLEPLNPVGIYFRTRPESHGANTILADLREEATVCRLLNEYRPEVIFHLAALVSPQVNEKNPALAIECHLRITENILKYIERSTHVIFLSTDKVFDGTVPCPDENTLARPVGLYGQLKWQCERLIQEHTEKHHIFRLPIVHDMGNPRSNSFVDKSLIALKSGNKISAFANVKRCYIRMNELVELLLRSADDDNYGIYHIGSDIMTYFDRIKKLCVEEHIKYEGLLEQGNGDVFPVVQNLDRNKAQKVFGIKFN